MDADAREAFSETASLAGVPGGLKEAMLGWRDGGLDAAAVGNTIEEVTVAGRDVGGGVSALGVATTRSVLSCCRFAGESVAARGVDGLNATGGARD